MAHTTLVPSSVYLFPVHSSPPSQCQKFPAPIEFDHQCSLGFRPHSVEVRHSHRIALASPSRRFESACCINLRSSLGYCEDCCMLPIGYRMDKRKTRSGPSPRLRRCLCWLWHRTSFSVAERPYVKVVMIMESCWI